MRRAQISRSVVGVEQAGVRHVDAELQGLAGVRRAVGIEAADDLELAEAQHGDGLGAGRLDHLDRRDKRGDRRLLLAEVGAVAEHVLRPDAEDHPRPRRRRGGVRPASGSSAAAPSPSAMLHRPAAVLAAITSAGMKFIDGEPMKPATKMLAGRR